MKQRRRYLWKQLPFIRIIPAFSAGYILSDFAGFTSRYAFITITISLFILLLLKIKPASFAWKYNAWRGVAIQLFIFSLPATLLFFDQKTNGADSTVFEHKEYFLLKINEPVTEKTNSYSATAKVMLINDGKATTVSGRAMITFSRKNSARPELSVGEHILVNARPSVIAENSNPGGFNYRKFLAEKGIHYQFFLKKNDWVRVDNLRSDKLNAEIFALRDAILNVLRKFIKDSTACGLAEALLVGYRNDVDNSVLQAYSNTGVVHVIAISGLHLGLIYLILMKLTSILIRNKAKKFIQPILVIGALWVFTLLSGASASVVRSAVMFTVLALGNLIGRKSSGINTLASSAFILLCFHPAWIKDIGFQLSYSAVASILLFHKKITNLYIFTNPIAFKLWEMISLTLAAQILTAPLLLLYFHQFPLLFLFTNLVAVPLSSLILAAELLLCVISPFTTIATETGNLTDFLIDKMNAYVLLMDRIPHSTIQSVNINIAQTILIYIAIFIAGLPVIIKRKPKLMAMMMIMVLFSLARLIVSWQSHRQQKFMVLNMRENSAMGWLGGTSAVYFHSKNVVDNEKKILKMFSDINIHYHVKKMKRLQFEDGQNLIITIAGFRIIRLTGNSGPHNIHPVPADIVILSHNYRGKLSEFTAESRCRIVIADATNNLWKIQEWKKQAEQLHLRFHSVPEQGAFLLDRGQFNSPEAVFADMNHSAR
jgi:competence protein ComEC